MAPAKVILFGEHFVVHGTSAVLCAVDMLVKVTVTAIDEPVLHIESEIESCKTNIIDGTVPPTLGPLGYIARKISEKSNHKGVHVRVESQIPHGVGLGSSSACCIAAAHAAAKLYPEYTNEDVFKIALQAERISFANASGADSAASMHGGVLSFDLGSDFKRLECPADLNLIVANSKMQRSTNDIVAHVGEFRAKNTAKFESLCKKESDLVANAISALKDGDLEKIGMYIKENQSYLDEIGISNETLDEMISIADRYGYGSKITGAGGGGCIISVVPPEKQNAAINALKDAGYESHAVKIDYSGVRAVNSQM